jgi:amino acid transporter
MKKNDNKMGAFDLFLFNIVSVFGISWFTNAAKMGPSQIVLWILAALLFFVPEGLVITELSTTWPLNGGLSAWVNEAYGKKSGFMTSWIYWIQGVIYFPAMLMQASVYFAYFIVQPLLGKNKVYISIFCVALVWIVTLANIRGFNFTKGINRFSSIFSFGLITVLVCIALYWRFGLHQAMQTHYTLSNMMPKFNNLKSIVFFSSMLFALAGLESPPSLIAKVRDPKHDFPKAIFYSSLVLPLLWMIGSTALTVVMSPEKIGLVSGLIDVISTVCNKAGIAWVVSLIGLFIFLFRIGSINVWLLPPLQMFFDGSKGYMPKWFSKVDEKYGTPKNALIIQAAFITVFTLMAYSMPSVEAAYWLISAMATVLYFIPFIIMFAAFIHLRIKKADVQRVYKAPAGIFVASVGFLVVIFATAISFLPPDGVQVGEIIKYEAELIGGPVIIFALGYYMFNKYKKINATNDNSLNN